MPAAAPPGNPPPAKPRKCPWPPAAAVPMRGPSSAGTANVRPNKTASARPAAKAAAERARRTDMHKEPKAINRYHDTPRDTPQDGRVEHANLERPGAQAHPKAPGWSRVHDPVAAWRLR